MSVPRNVGKVRDSVFEEHHPPARMEVTAVPAASQPESQDDILAAALAALTDADIPPDDYERGPAPTRTPGGPRSWPGWPPRSWSS